MKLYFGKDRDRKPLTTKERKESRRNIKAQSAEANYVAGPGATKQESQSGWLWLFRIRNEKFTARSCLRGTRCSLLSC